MPLETKTIAVEIWEHQNWEVKRGWRAGQDYRTREGVAAASTLETYAPPRGYIWANEWKVGILFGRNNQELPDGWEYALKLDHFFGAWCRSSTPPGGDSVSQGVP